jgi:HJR/Mrr/RecB family endonuclease
MVEIMNWVFQYNPRRWDQLRESGPNDQWAMNQNRDIASVGDVVYFWRSGPEAGLTAVGHVATPVYEKQSDYGEFQVGVQYDALVEPPLTRDEIRRVPVLSEAAVFQGWQGTNFRISDEQAAALDTLLSGRLKQNDTGAGKQVNYDNVQDLGEAITRSNRRVKAELRTLVRSMDPRAFEFLVRRVLIVLGYRNVTVTQYSGDKGIDATAVFDVGGATPVDVAVQAKRTNTVDRPTVQNVRGSLTNRQLGLIVTAGTFTASAITEAQEPGKVPIGLIDGAKLLDIMVQHRIGVEEKSFPALSLVPETLSIENLSAQVAEA